MSYFDENAIVRSAKLPVRTMKEGEKLLREGAVRMAHYSTGYLSDNDGMVAQFDFEGKERNIPLELHLVVSRDRVVNTVCDCRECSKNYYWYESVRQCKYTAAMLRATQEFLQQHDLGDSTDRTGMQILNTFQGRQANRTIAQTLNADDVMTIEPRLTMQDELELSFRYGSGKKFIVKDLVKFCQHFDGEERDVYGSKTEFPHSVEMLDERGKKWLSLIRTIIREEINTNERLNQRRVPWGRYGRYYVPRGTSLKCPAFQLFGWRLDQFYATLGSDGAEYEDKRDPHKNKRTIFAAEGKPDLRLIISPELYGNKKVFQGVHVECAMPEFLEGMDGYYFIRDTHLFRTDKESLGKIRPFLEHAGEGGVSFSVGKKKLSDFYYGLLPQFQDSMEVIEKDSDIIQKNLQPQVLFTFYLDAPEEDITCRIQAGYGEQKFSCLDYLREDFDVEEAANVRMENKEQEVLFRTRMFFPEVNFEQNELYCERNENSIFNVLNQGLEELARMGEVRCTDRFNRLNTVRKLKFAVGVSVSEGLLDLEISSDDVSKQELLDILASYRLRRRYHRLKNGEFVTLENDEELEMLSEMLYSLQITPKEFVKGKMHLPLYRTLYLDKLLEEHESVYENRDAHFRQLVKEFKTVKESDYEVPDSLRSRMRGYQRLGYKWLRTLEARQFGGILADEMGLGKTLQMIAVLVSAKEEGRKAPSLVVCPASLVYNWCEEFERFSPELTVMPVTGTQEARQKKIAEAGEYDVLVTSYDLLKRDVNQYEDLSFEYEVIDEAQYIKNHTTAAAKAVKVIHSRHRFALTGTPIENRLSELWSIFDYLMPGFLYGYETFRKEVEIPVVKYNDEGAMQRLQRMAGPFILRRCKNDVLKDLPDKLEENRYVQMEEQQQKLYDAQVVRMQEMLNSQDDSDFRKNKIQVLAELTRLRQVCCDPSLCYDGYQGGSAKLESCLDLIESAIDGGHKILLFSQFTTMLDILQKSLQERKIAHYVITGATSKEKRLQMVKSFNGDDTPLFLISLKAGGVGLNLTGADVVIHYDPWWNLAVQNQATDRAHRIGQTKKVTVYKMLVRHSIEEKIQKLQESKRKLAEQILDADAADIGSMTREELLELLL